MSLNNHKKYSQKEINLMIFLNKIHKIINIFITFSMQYYAGYFEYHFQIIVNMNKIHSYV
jgi:hypothetical protein